MATQDALKAIHEADAATRERWRHALNTWRWPGDLPGKPDGFDEAPSIARSKYQLMQPAWNLLGRLVPHKRQLRYHWLNELGKTEEEFEAWYAEEHPESTVFDFGESHAA